MGKGPGHLLEDTDAAATQGPQHSTLRLCCLPALALVWIETRLLNLHLKQSLLKHRDQDLITLSFPSFFKFFSDQYTNPLPVPFRFLLLFLVTCSCHLMSIHQSYRQLTLLLREARVGGGGGTRCKPEGAMSPHTPLPPNTSCPVPSL